MVSIRRETGTVLQGKRNHGRGQSSEPACYLSFGHRTRALQVVTEPPVPGKAHSENARRVSGRPYETLQPPLSEVMQRFCFNSRSRKPGESVAAYVAKPRCIAERCNYGDTLDKMLRDRLVWGINDDSIQKKLLQESDLTYQRAVTLAQGAETAEENLKAPGQELVASQSARVIVNSEPVYKVSGKKPGPKDSGVKCHRCSIAGHMAPTCRFRDRTCYKCKKKGHMARVCRSKGTPPPPQGDKSRKSDPRHPVRRVEEESDQDSDSDELTQSIRALGQEGEGRTPAIKVQVDLDDCIVPMEVDTGASVSIMAEATYRKLWPRRSLGTSKARLQTYPKEPIEVVGGTNVQVSYEGQTAQLPWVVVRGRAYPVGEELDEPDKVELEPDSPHN